MLDKVQKIQRLGLEVWCGMIVGFDHDTADIFDAQVKFVAKANIAHAMVGMLTAIPKTPLHARLGERAASIRTTIGIRNQRRAADDVTRTAQ